MTRGSARVRRLKRERRRGVVVFILVLGVAVLLLAALFDRRAGPSEIVGPPVLPPEAEDPSNRPLLIEGGVLPRSIPDPEADDVESGPRSTRDEGIGPMWVAVFWIQEHEVTNEEFLRHDAYHQFPSGEERHPVANVTWEEAWGYAASIGGRLPTEAQWEFAARGPEGRKYPWGDAEPTCERAWHRDCGPRGSTEVMTRLEGVTPDGVHDMAGNVWEWTTPNWFDPGRTPVNDETRRMRGGSFDDPPFFLRASNRNNGFFPGYKYVSIGFRVVWGASTGRE